MSLGIVFQAVTADTDINETMSLDKLFQAVTAVTAVDETMLLGKLFHAVTADTVIMSQCHWANCFELSPLTPLLA